MTSHMRRLGLRDVAMAVGIALAAGTACTSKPAGMVTGDAGGGAGTAGGASGMAGLTGAAGDGGSVGDGGIDAPLGVDGAIDVAAATSPTEVCREAIAVQCQRLAECFDIAAYGCDESAILCPGYYFGPHSLRTVANVQACIASIRQMTCTDLQMGFASACLAGGTGEGGAPCSAASECASRYCSEIYPTCGTCGPPLELGATCGSVASGTCRSGTICHPATRVCVPTPLAVTHARAGEACDLSGNPPVGCEGALLCLPAMPGATQGTCTSRAALPKAGEPCLDVSPAYSIKCASGLTCGLSTADGGRTLLCGDPAPCGTTSCPSGEYCYEAPAVSIRCQPYALAGQPCSTGAPEGDQRCAAGLACTGGTRSGDGGSTYRGTCNPRVSLDEPCDDVRLCRAPLVCQQGRCARLDPETCFLPSDAGAGQ
jgi:hypothetical protein